MAEAYIDGLNLADTQLARNLKKKISERNPRFDATEVMDIAELAGKIDRHANPEQFIDARKSLATRFELPGTVSEIGRRPDISSVLIHELGLRRIITLNYDHELEWTAFVSPEERKSKGRLGRQRIFERAFASNGEGSKRHRMVPGFGPVVSEVLGKENSADLTSFGLHDDDTRCRILHLHGRADVPGSMIVSRRDYRDLYWQSGFSRLPFEYAFRSIVAGNPILFVGIGMSEAEINKHFERFLSDNPNRRSLPMFLLWNSHGNARDDQAFRLLYNRKLGVSVLFDKEIATFCGKEAEYEVELASADPSSRSALRMALPLRYLARWCHGKDESEPSAEQLRSPQSKYEVPDRSRINMWHALGNDAPNLIEGEEEHLAKALRGAGPLISITGKPGSGRGSWAEKIATVLGKSSTRNARIVVVNGSFATETDSIFGILSGAFDCQTAFNQGQSRVAATQKMTSELDTWPRRKSDSATEKIDELVLIINGMERFVAHNGTAISTELDVLIRIITGHFRKQHERVREFLRENSTLRLILIGSPRLLRYLDQMAPDQFSQFEVERDYGRGRTVLSINQQLKSSEFVVEGKAFFEHVCRTLRLPGTPPSDLTDSRKRKHFLEQIAGKIRTERGSLAFEVLRVMAFIGQPVERHVIPHMVARPIVSNGPTNTQISALSKKVEKEIEWLRKKGLILDIVEFPKQSQRIGLHKALVAEIRERYGVPLSDARLAASFNLGLYAAQPLDGVRPDQDWHDELARMVDFLCGQYRDDVPVQRLLVSEIKRLKQDPISNLELKQHFLADLSLRELASLACARQSDCLRAALSLLRSYFSTSSLVMHPNHELDTWLRNAPLTDHADRLRRLIRMFESNTVLRRLLLKNVSPSTLKELSSRLGAPAFYSDDLCWLFNELGVVLVTQGDLLGAREAFDRAMLINNRLVEFGERHHNWRRIAFNLVQVAIDQGRLNDAEELLREIETSLEADARLVSPEELWKEPPWSKIEGAPYASLRDYVLRRFSKQGGKKASRAVDAHFPANLILGIGLVLGYRGLCNHLRGELTSADEFLSSAVRLMELLGEQRAFSIFQRHRVSLLRQLQRVPEAIEAQKLCVSSAGPSRQTDIDHSGRLALGEMGFFAGRDQEHWRHAQMLPQLKETLRYATACDMYRLQIEVLQLIAFMQLKLGDTDSALAFVSDAMAIASRNDFGLRKIGLRALYGKILASRNQKEAASKVLNEASLIGTRRGYARGSEVAEDELVKLEADRVSMNAGSARRE